MAKLFKKDTGMMPTEFVNHHRIECSKRILSEPELKELTIPHIAESMGYTDPEEYTTLFYLKEGITPEEYRKQQLSDEEREV